MDLETNATMGLARENSLLLRRGPLGDESVVKMAQTFRSEISDIDAVGASNVPGRRAADEPGRPERPATC